MELRIKSISIRSKLWGAPSLIETFTTEMLITEVKDVKNRFFITDDPVTDSV
jgi:hypothetical protein